MCSVGYNNIIGDGAEKLAKVVLEHTVLSDFCGIPLVSLRQNTITELDLEGKGVGVPGAIVLSSLLPSATALASLKYAAAQRSLLSAPPDTFCAKQSNYVKRPSSNCEPEKRHSNAFFSRSHIFLSAMSSAPIRHVDAGHVLMSDGWVVRGTARPALFL